MCGTGAPGTVDDVDIRDDSALIGIDEKSVLSLNGHRVGMELLDLVPNADVFRGALRCIKYWARRRGIYGNILGFPGGVAYAILVARVCQLYPNAAASTIISRFFRWYSGWKFVPCNGLLLCPIREHNPTAATADGPAPLGRTGSRDAGVASRERQRERDTPLGLKVWSPKHYPADRLEIRLALEADDRETIAAARALALDRKYRIVLVPEGGPRTKPRALNYALRFCSGEIITVHDAEDRPHPRQLRTAAESFAAAGPDLACLQAPLNWFNRSECWLTRQFALEYAAHFHALLPLYARLRWPLPLGGTSNHFRAAALRRAGGWDAWNVTEDADLGFRLHALGYRCNVIAPLTLEEAPTRIWPWVCQRSRWLKGYAQTLAVHSRTQGSEAGGQNGLADKPPLLADALQQ